MDFHLLLVEDDPTNRVLTRRLLERAGYQVAIAEDGNQAVEAFGRQDIDLVLMDIQMPVMDGYCTSRAIRALEQGAASARAGGAGACRRVPILAMTGHATEEHHESCSSAGIDDYLVKPFSKAELVSILNKWLHPGSAPASRAHHDRGGEVDAPLDLACVLGEFDQDQGFLRDVLEKFLEQAAQRMTMMRSALVKGDGNVLGREAHALKGGAAFLRAGKLAEIAERLENVSHSGNLGEGREMLAVLDNELGRLFSYARDNLTGG